MTLHAITVLGHDRPGIVAETTDRLAGLGLVTVTTDAFEARALQHEMGHCAGLLFLDQVAGAHAIHPRQTYL